MDSSPLTQQARPESFQPKIARLYELLFKDEDGSPKSEGFWREFFLLRPDRPRLQRILDELSPDEIIHEQSSTRALFSRAIAQVQRGVGPSDIIALDTLTAFLGVVLTKKYTNPSFDTIAVLAGLDEADAVFTNFVDTLESVIRRGRDIALRRKAVETALALTAGAYQTSLMSFLIHRDLFPCLMKYIHDLDTPERAFEPFLLVGLLANHNKFEFQNPYRLRMNDFVNEATIQKIIRCIGVSCKLERDKYVAVQDDLPEGWTLSGTLSYFGLGVLTPSAKVPPPVLSAEEVQERFALLPGPETAVLLATYDFTEANKVVAFTLVSSKADQKNEEDPFSSFLSFSSYLLHHAYRSSRAALYAYINLFIIRILVEDLPVCKFLCDGEKKAGVRLCRQRLPHLPLVCGDRVFAAIILDIMVDTLNHNLRRRLDINLYLYCLGIAHRLISFLSASRIRIAYHWAEVWRGLLAVLRFLTTYAPDFTRSPDVRPLLDSLVNLIVLSLSNGEAFLPDPAAYDDLFYKLVESGPVLTKFRDVYQLDQQDALNRPNSIGTLISVVDHYQALIANENKTKGKKHLSPREVNTVIKKGYESLSIQSREGLDRWERFREAEEKVILKRVARVAVEDVRRELRERT